jgi:hypothetical protein
MQRRHELNFVGRFPQQQHSGGVIGRSSRGRSMFVAQRSRGLQRNLKLPFLPPENWHAPQEHCQGYRILTQEPGSGYRHVLSPDDVRQRLSELPARFCRDLQVVQLSRMTRKKRGFPCYGMQWGTSLYLYPIEETLVERYHSPPTPAQLTEARMYGGQWEQESNQVWRLVWTEAAIRDFYLNNILIHELGHLVDHRNDGYRDRERFAEWFAIQYGYKTSRRLEPTRGASPRRRHHKRSFG